MVFANTTGENPRVSNSVIKVTRLIEIVGWITQMGFIKGCALPLENLLKLGFPAFSELE